MKVHPQAGKPAEPSMLVDVDALVKAYYDRVPDPSVPAQRVAFGTSGHRGSALLTSFNEAHILAATQAICLYRRSAKIDGPLFLGFDTHALSAPAFRSAMEVLAANEVTAVVSEGGEFTPTPAISHAILTYNKDRHAGLADGIVITPSHNPPEDGGFKYNPPEGGPADKFITSRIEAEANSLLERSLRGVDRVPFEQAMASPNTRSRDYLSSYVDDLESIIDMETIAASGVRLGVDPLGGASVHYWRRIAGRFGLELDVTNEAVDPTFRFMTVDWDGRIRMDPSSPYAMRRLIGLKDRYDVAFACDTDADRHGIVTRSAGLLQTNQFLAAAIDYLFRYRRGWPREAGIGKTLVSSSIIDRVAARLGRRLYEMPVGFKWFVEGLVDGSLGFAGEESAGASFLRSDGGVWTTDKDGIVPTLLAAEMTARLGRDPGELYKDLTGEFGEPFYDRVDAPATPEEKAALGRLSPADIKTTELAGEKILEVINKAPANGAPFGGIKVKAANGWFAARPSGTENIYKIYAESFLGRDHLGRVLDEAQAIVDRALRG